MKLKQVDVFTDKPFFGNPVAVVLGAETLDAQAMQRIACWTNLSETTFLLKSSTADYRLRIFTPRQELPFAGHPTIGSAHAALESGFVGPKKKLLQECGAGLIELSVEDDGRIFLKGPAAKPQRLERQIPSIPLAPASAVMKVDVGPVWVVAEVGDAVALAALKPDMTALAEWSDALHVTGVTVFAPSGEAQSQIHVRSFAPAHGIPEDPVCGSGNLSVGVFLRETKQLDRFGKAYVARQGMQLGRDGKVAVRVHADHIEIGGHAVTCVDGEIGRQGRV
ncbi:MAG TPA: PhzF family phenazine biosynthesis protein [Burkholderiales bacterium]|nr:PhzF family phenazine biosynthesis protein [Burkholderiales bacterium]